VKRLLATVTLAACAFARTAFAHVEVPDVPPSAEELSRLSEALIYSVGRTPEHMFDTARDVEVLTQEEIQRINAETLGDLLERQLGFEVVHGESGSLPVLRGLAGKHVMILIDGVKVNNASWRDAGKEYLAIFDLSQIERIEIVRGVVSVLGTESLGGVVNIITIKAPGSQTPQNATLAMRYSSANRAITSSLLAAGVHGKLRYAAGVSFTDAGDIRGGEGVGVQRQTSYRQKAAHLNGQWLLSSERTITFGYQLGRAEEVETPGTPAGRGVLLRGTFDPSQLQHLRISYLDLTDRWWEESLQITAYLNDQVEERDAILSIGLDVHDYDHDRLAGFNVELGSFFGAHHLVYGFDYTTERVRSWRVLTERDSGAQTRARGNLIDHSRYHTASAYIQDQTEITRWVTLIGGVRLARYESRGSETLPLGRFDIAQQRTNLTGAINAIFHVTPQVNLVASAIRGYRPPNLDDSSHFGQKPGFIELPNVDVSPEKVISYEAGVKYRNRVFEGALFYFQNHFTDLLVRTGTTFNGQAFDDQNGNGIRDAGESVFLQNQNVGNATIRGLEAHATYRLSPALTAFAGYSRLTGRDEVLETPLSAMPAASGSLGIRWSGTSARRPWAELEGRFRQAQRRLSPTDLADIYIGPDGGRAYQVVDVRGGCRIGTRLSLTVALENLLDRRYRAMGSNRDEPGRQLVLGTRLRF